MLDVQGESTSLPWPYNWNYIESLTRDERTSHVDFSYLMPWDIDILFVYEVIADVECSEMSSLSDHDNIF